jgi:hypothetical protein
MFEHIEQNSPTETQRFILPPYSPDDGQCNFRFFKRMRMALQNQNLLTQMTYRGSDRSVLEFHFWRAPTPLSELDSQIGMIYRKELRVLQ